MESMNGAFSTHLLNPLYIPKIGDLISPFPVRRNKSMTDIPVKKKRETHEETPARPARGEKCFNHPSMSSSLYVTRDA